MNIDLSLIDKVGADSSTPAQAKPSRFAPRARARPAQKAAPAKPVEPVQPEASQLPVQQVEAEEGGPAPHVKESLTTAAAEPPAAAPQPPTPASPAHVETPTTPPTPPNEQAAMNEKSSHEEGRVTRHIASQAVNTTALVAAASGAKGSGGEDTDTDEDQPQKKKPRKGSGRRARRARISKEELAAAKLNPGTAPIKEFVRRAHAQECLRREELKRKRAEHIAGDEEEQQLAIEPAPQTALSMAVQMELDENGKLVPKAQSMVIQAQAQPLYRQVTEYNNVVNNNSFTKRMHSDRWNEQETDAFFAAVKTFGTDFGLLAKLFPGRPRRSLVLKWRREGAHNPERVNDCYLRGDSTHADLQKIVAAMANVPANAEGITEDLGTDAMQLFDTAQPKLMGDGDDDDEEPEAMQDPPSAQPVTDARAESTPRESAEPPAGGPSRKVSRRKTAPAKSVPSEYQAEPPQRAPRKGGPERGAKVGRKSGGKKPATKRNKWVEGRGDSSDEEEDDESFKGPKVQVATKARVTRARAAKQ